MTDKKNDKIQSMDVDLLSASDEQLLQAFFADNKMAFWMVLLCVQGARRFCSM